MSHPKASDRTVSSIGWHDFDAGVREQILHHSHPAKTVAVEWVAADAHLTRYEFTRERKRIRGPYLLKISVTRRAGTADARTYTWHNVSKIRLHIVAHSYYTFEFIGKDADGSETTFYPPDWVSVDDLLFRHHCHHNFQGLGLTRHRTRTWDAEVLEYSFV
jgi:hypothetical protein